MDDYAVRREARRRRQLLMFVAMCVVLDVALGFRTHWLVAVLVAATVLAAFVVAHLVASMRDGAGVTGLDRQPPRCAAQVPVWALTRRGCQLRTRMREESELMSRLSFLPDRIEWHPGKGAQRIGASPITWMRRDLTHAEVGKSWGVTPMAHLFLSSSNGSPPTDIWVRASKPKVESVIHSPLLA